VGLAVAGGQRPVVGPERALLGAWGPPVGFQVSVLPVSAAF